MIELIILGTNSIILNFEGNSPYYNFLLYIPCIFLIKWFIILINEIIIGGGDVDSLAALLLNGLTRDGHLLREEHLGPVVPVPVVVGVDAVVVVVILQLVEDGCAKEENRIYPYFFLSIKIQIEGSTHLSNYRSINKKLGLLAYIFSPVSRSSTVVAKLPVEPKSISNYFVILEMRVKKDV